MRYTIENIQQRDTWVHKGSGQEMQTYAIKLSGEAGWIKLNQLITTKPPQIGDALNGNIVDKGDVRIFKKEFNQGGSGVSTEVIEKKLDEINQKLDMLMGVGDSSAVNNQDGTNPDTEIDYDKPADLSDIPF